MAKKIKKSINWTRVLWLYVLAFVAFALLTILPHILKDVQNINFIKILIQLVATMLGVWLQHCAICFVQFGFVIDCIHTYWLFC